ncbi:hypothetical protein CYMTET_49108 [Cymbomonas tetramitiformis]|uniref:Uncharacterized protein n=1 Tax=Cymbomonas tetramitiformis TaxID=36881 RepID=A0AAE0BS41_9CHLO|nr:hypothetical protein CYMTET_49108 [Cymbomonas tetramitiformis]
MRELRAQRELDPSSSHRGGEEALRAKLQFVEDRVYQASDATGEAAERNVVHGGRQLRSDAVDRRGLQSEVEAWSSTGFRSRGVVAHKWLDAEKEILLANAEDRKVVRRLRDGSVVRQRWSIIEHLGLEVDLKHGQFCVTDQHLGCEGEDFACGVVGPGVEVATASDEQVDRSQDLEATDESEAAHRLIDDGVGWRTQPQASCERILVGRDARLAHHWGPNMVDRFASEIDLSATTAVLRSLEGSSLYPGIVKGFNEDGAAHVVYDDGVSELVGGKV